MKFRPPIPSRTTDELICISQFPEDWNPKAVEQAKQELKKRGITLEEQKKRASVIESTVQEFNRREYEQREYVSFGVLEIAYMAFDLPSTIMSDWHLKREGYSLLFKQRLYAIAIGMVLWAAMLVWISWSSDQEDLERQKIINKIDIYEWEKGYYSETELREIREREIEEVLLTINSEKYPSVLLLDNDTIHTEEMERIKALDPLAIRNIFIEEHNEPYRHHRIEIFTLDCPGCH